MPNINSEDILRETIAGVVDEAVKRIADALIFDAVKTFDCQLRKRIGEVAISLANLYTVERHGHELVIRIQITRDGPNGS